MNHKSMIDDIILTEKTVDELKELFKTKYGVELEEYGFVY